MMYGTDVKSALKSMKTTRRVPALIIDPSVGHASFVMFALGGEYAILSKPTEANTLA
jgi:hypothetical protein